MFSIFKNYKRRNADLLLLSEAVATLRNEVSFYQDSIFKLKEKTEELETELENCVTLRRMRDELDEFMQNDLDEFMRNDSWDYFEYNVDQAVDDKLTDYLDSDEIDDKLDEYFTQDQAKAELAKLSAMLFVTITRSGLDFDEIESASQPVFDKFMQGHEDNI